MIEHHQNAISTDSPLDQLQPQLTKKIYFAAV
jgi:hypothetical protein